MFTVVVKDDGVPLGSAAMRFRWLAIVLVTAWLSTPAAADTEGWTWLEYRQPITQPSTAPAVSLRLFTDFRFAGRTDGLYNSFLRVGPLFDIAPWLLVAVHGTAVGHNIADEFQQELRAELEPWLRFQVGTLRIFDRNRLEVRRFPGDTRLRYRNLLRLEHDLGGPWLGALSNEALFDLFDGGFQQNRAFAGIGFRFGSAGQRIELSYMFRSRRAMDDWTHDHAAVVYLLLMGQR